MALKADRHELDVDISYFYNAGTATRGGVVVLDTVGSGAAMDQATNLVKYKVATSSDFAVGILLNDVVNLDLTRQHINWHKDEVQKGGKVSLLKKGYVVTSNITGTPTKGALACADDATTAGNIALCSGSTVDLIIGRFMSLKDEDGYAKVEDNLPAAADPDGGAGLV